MEGVEPSWISPPVSETGAYAYSATSAYKKPPRGFEPLRPGSKPGALPLSYGGKGASRLPVVISAATTVERAAVPTAVLEPPARAAWAGVAIAKPFEQLLVAALH